VIDRLLINQRYARLWAGQATSLLGDAVFDTTLVLWVATVLARHDGHTASWAPIAVGALTAIVGAAVLVVGPLSGVFVDRWNRRTTMLRTEILRMVVVGALTVVSFLPVRALPIGAWLTCIYVVVFGVNGAGQFFNQSRFAVIGEVVDGPADRARAAGIGQATSGAVSIIGPPLAAPLLITVGLQWALLFNTLTYVVSYAMVRSIRLAGVDATGDAMERPNYWREFRAGLRWFAGNRYITRILYGFLIAGLGSGALTSLMIFFLTTNLHANAKWFGLVDTFFGIGAIAGALVSGRVVKLLGPRRTVWLGMMIGGLLVVLLARQTVFIAGAVLFTAIALPTIAYNTAMTPLLLANTPKEYLGRMLSVLNPALQLATMASVLVSGWLASTVLRGYHAHVAGIAMGPYDIVFTLAGLLIVAGAAYHMVALPRDEAPVAEVGELVAEPA
jgi:MFS family permease